MRLPKVAGFDRSSIKEINDFASLQIWLDRFLARAEYLHRLEYDTFIGRLASETPNWRIREASAADVSDGIATTEGNLIVTHKTNGTKHEFEAA